MSEEEKPPKQLATYPARYLRRRILNYIKQEELSASKFLILASKFYLDHKEPEILRAQMRYIEQMNKATDNNPEEIHENNSIR